MAERVVAVTGGVASGKSALCEALAAQGLPVFDADIAAREAVAPGSEGLAAVVTAFGPDVLDTAGGLDRAAMRARIFADPAARTRLEAIVHPRVRTRLHAQARAAGADIAIVAIPLLAEGGGRGSWPWLWRIVAVDVPPAVQRARLMARDGADAALAERMIAAQATRAQRLAIADDVVINDGPRAAQDAIARRLLLHWRGHR